MRTLTERFWRKVERRGGDECWLWKGAVTSRGYGSIRAPSRGPTLYAHRVSYELNVGPILRGLKVLHRCDCRSCCNPSHLFLGTQNDNVQDMLAKNRGRWKTQVAEIAEINSAVYKARFTNKQAD